MGTATADAGVGQVLRQRAFRFLWLSQLISQVGDRLTLVVLPLAVTELSGSTSAVGAVLAARYVPLVLLALIGGVWADRLPRRSIMLVCDAARLALHGTLAILFITGVVEVWHVILIEALFAVAEAFNVPAYQGLVPQALDDDRWLQPAMALSAMTRNIAQLLGPALGTAVFAIAGAGWAFAIDAATFALAALLLLQVRARRRGAPVVRTGMLRELKEGFLVVRRRTWLWGTILIANLWLLLADGPFSVLGPTLGEEAYGDAAIFGVAASVFGGGLVVGSLVAARLRPARPLVVGYLGLVPVSLAYVAFGLGLPLALTLGCSAIGGVGAALFDVMWYTAMASDIPPEALSRASSFDWVGSLASLPIAYLLAGSVAHVLGAAEVLVGGGLLSLGLIGAGLLSPAIRDFTPKAPPG